jgi:hypothetical protein
VGILALPLVFAGCFAQQPPSSPAAVDPVCVAFAAVEARIADVRALEQGSTTIDELRTALIDLQAAWFQLRDAARDLSNSGMSELNDALLDLQRALAVLPPTVEARDARELISDELDAVVAAAHATSDELGCVDQLASAT